MKFRKKPVVIEAVQFREIMKEWPLWLAKAVADGTTYFQGGPTPYYTIKTLEGDHRAGLGDWIIRGVKGELYPCKPDIFEATYEAVDEPFA